MNPKEIAEKYEKPRMQMLEIKKTEIRENNKTNGVGHSSCRCNRHVSVNWQVARLVNAIINITIITDVTVIVANTTNMICANFFKLIYSSGFSFASTCPAFILWLRTSSSRALQVIAITIGQLSLHFCSVSFFFPSLCPASFSMLINSSVQ